MKYTFKNIAILSGKVIFLLTIILIFSHVNIIIDKKEKEDMEKEIKRLNHYGDDGDDEGHGDVDDDDKIMLTKEGYAARNVIEGFSEKAKNFNSECKIEISMIIKFIYYLLVALFTIIVFIWNIIKYPLELLFKKALGKYYKIIIKVFMISFKIQKTIFSVLLRILGVILKIVFSILNIILRILFQLIPQLLLNIFSIFLSFPLSLLMLILLKIKMKMAWNTRLFLTLL